MEMRVDPVSKADVALVNSWWHGRGLGTLPEGVLPPVGFLASDDHGPAAAGWIYQPVGCTVAFVDWLVTRPGLDARRARRACRAVFTALRARADTDGCTRLFASVESAAMIREAKACGFHVAACGMTHLVSILDHGDP
jgi:hypothetical protein